MFWSMALRSAGPMSCHIKALSQRVTQSLDSAPHPGKGQLTVKLIYHPGWYRKFSVACRLLYIKGCQSPPPSDLLEQITEFISGSIWRDLKTFHLAIFSITRWGRLIVNFWSPEIWFCNRCAVQKRQETPAVICMLFIWKLSRRCLCGRGRVGFN